jgi:hypothetical protein
VSHDESFVSPDASKSVHNGDLTKREKRVCFDEDEAGVLPRVLATDEHFLAAAAIVAAAAHRDEEADNQAAAYAPYRGRHRDYIASLLVAACEREPPLRRTYLANRHRTAIWADAKQDELEPLRVRTRWPRLEEGAQRVAALGARRCIGCGGPLRRGHRLHCSRCWERFPEGVRNSHAESMRVALDAATGQRRAQRAARRASA